MQKKIFLIFAPEIVTPREVEAAVRVDRGVNRRASEPIVAHLTRRDVSREAAARGRLCERRTTTGVSIRSWSEHLAPAHNQKYSQHSEPSIQSHKQEKKQFIYARPKSMTQSSVRAESMSTVSSRSTKFEALMSR